MLASFATAIGAAVLVVLPVVLFRRDVDIARLMFVERVESIAPSIVIGAVYLLLIAFGIGVGHLASIALRSRSPWVALQVFGLPVLLFLAWLFTRPLLFSGAMKLVAYVGVTLGIAILVAMFVASLAGIVGGRTDIREVQRTSAITFISIVAVAVVVIGLYSIWVRSVDIEDLTETYLHDVSADGSLLAVHGPSRGRGDFQSMFLLDPARGWQMSVPFPPGGIEFSADGKRVIWGALESFNPLTSHLVIADLAGKEVATRESKITYYPQSTDGPVISPKGDRAASLNNGILSVYSLNEDRVLASVKVHEVVIPRTRLSFVNNDVVRMYVGERGASAGATAFRIAEYDLAKRTLQFTGSFSSPASYLRFNPSMSRLLNRHDDKSYALRDARTGELVKLLPTVSRVGVSRVVGHTSYRWLSDGRIASVDFENGRSTLTLFDPDGGLVRQIDLGPMKSVMSAHEPMVGRIGVIAEEPGSTRERTRNRLLLVDPESGAVKQVSENVRPFVRLYSRTVPAGSAASRMFVDAGGRLFLIDPATGERTRLVTD